MYKRQHQIFLAQFNAIKDIAKEGPCVIVGRCADYALADFPNVVNVYLYADMQSRIARIARRHDAVSYTHLDVYKRQLLLLSLSVRI